MSEPFTFNPLDPAVRRAPYAFYERGRRELPAFVHEGMPVRLVSIFRYDDCLSVLRNTELYSNDFSAAFAAPAEFAELGDMGPPSMIGTDPPEHTRLRSLVNKAFTPRIVSQLEPRLEAVAKELMRDAVEKGEVDLVQALTYPLPVAAIAEIIGIPTEDRAQFKLWSDKAIANLGLGFFAPPSLEQLEEQRAVTKEMHDYFTPLAEDRRTYPRDDLLSGLVRAEHEGSKLSFDEMMSMLVLLLVAGNETTTTLIGSAVLDLLEHPGELARLRADPALLPGAVDEVLRFSSPVQFDARRVTAASEIAGTTIEANDLILPWLASANRDESVFDQPERFDIGRTKNPHIAFGNGTHHCLGHNLARLEAQVALRALLSATSSFERADHEELPLHPSPVFRGFSKIPVRLEPA